MELNRLLLFTPTNPRKMLEFFNEKKDYILNIAIISVDYPPLELGLKKKTKTQDSIFGKKTNQTALYDVAGVIVTIAPIEDIGTMNLEDQKSIQIKNQRKIFIVANDVMFMSSNNQKIVSINGRFDVLPEELMSKVYANFPDLKSINLEELEEILQISNDETAIKAFRKLGNYFTAKNYEINNNIFNLIKHQEESESVAKKVLLKKMVAWEIKE